MKPLAVQDALDSLSAKGEAYLTKFTHGTLEVGIYKPAGHDPQKPHKRDEVYVIATGTSSFFIEGESEAFAPAGAEHRFIDFNDDFSTWVFFYGPDGGES